MSDEALSLSGITRVFPGTVALDGVDFSLAAGEVHGLVGENGAGKSTLMNIINGSQQPDGGQIRVFGRQVQIDSPHVARTLGISMVHQELKLFPDLSVAENVFFSRQVEGGLFVDWNGLYERTRRILQRLSVSFGPRDRVRDLSIAQQQQVEIAKALSHDSKILIMDEPTASLTLDEAEVLFSVIRGLAGEGISVIYISHRLEEVFRICDRVTVLRDGRKIRTMRCADASKGELVDLMIGGRFGAAEGLADGPRTTGEVVLSVEGLTIEGTLRDIRFQLHRGEVLGIAGLVGSGRTELLQALSGATRNHSGRIRVRGRGVSVRSPREAIAAGIALMPEDRKGQGLVLGMSVKHNIVFASLRRVFRLGFLHRRLEQQDARRMIDSLAIRVDSPERAAGTLSGGNQQKVVFAKWLLADTEILLLDEPTRGIDVGAKEEIFKVIESLAAQGKSLIFVSSELQEVIRVSDRILVLHDRKLAAELPRGVAIGELIQYVTGVKTA